MDVADLQAILDMRGGRWHVPGLKVLSAEPGRVVVRLDVAEPVANIAGMLHGGAAATLVDVVGTLAIMTADRDGRPGVSTDLNVTWFAAAPVGETVLIEATAPKVGRTLGFCVVEIRRESDGAFLVQGRMTKALGNPRS